MKRFSELPAEIFNLILNELSLADNFRVLKTNKTTFWEKRLTFPAFLNKFTATAHICERPQFISLNQYHKIANSHEELIEKLKEQLPTLISNLKLVLSADIDSLQWCNQEFLNVMQNFHNTVETIVTHGYETLLKITFDYLKMLHAFSSIKFHLDQARNDQQYSLLFLSTLNGYPEISKLLSETESNFTEASSELMPIDNPWLETAAISTDSHQLSLICDPIHNLALSNPEGFRRLWRDPHCNSQISESLTPAIRAILNNQDLEIAFIFYNKHHETEMTFIEFIDQTDNLGWNCRDWTAALNHTGNPHIAVNQPGKRI